MVDHADIAAALDPFGMFPRGGFHPGPGDEIDAATVVLVGNAGPAMWQAFARDRRTGADPLDSWTREVLAQVASALGARAIFPFGGPPFHPFMRWAERAGSVHRSPVGLLIHPEYGLWHAYRGLLAFASRIALPPPDGPAEPVCSVRGEALPQRLPGRRLGARWLRRRGLQGPHRPTGGRRLPRPRLPGAPRLSGRHGVSLRADTGRIPHARLPRPRSTEACRRMNG